MQDLNRNTKYQYSIPVCRENWYSGTEKYCMGMSKKYSPFSPIRHERANEHTQRVLGDPPQDLKKRGPRTEGKLAATQHRPFH